MSYYGSMAIPRSKKPKAQARAAFKGESPVVDRRNAVRRSVSLDPDVDAMAHRLAGDRDFSSFVNEALRRDIQRTQMLSLLGDLDEEFGLVGDAAKAKAEELWQARSRSTAER
jgi:hypothetical protein